MSGPARPPLVDRVRDQLLALGAEVPAGGDLAALRSALEAADAPGRRALLDPLLLEVRSLELAGAALPSSVGGARRDRPLAIDAVSSTWESWRPEDGARVALRALRADLQRDPVWLRRLTRGARSAAGLDGICPVSPRTGAPVPHVMIELGGPSLDDLLPAEDPADLLDLARFLAGGLRGLRALHAAGLTHGGLEPAHLRVTPDGVRLAWFDPILPGDAPRDARADLAALGRAVGRLDPGGDAPLGDLALSWAEAPPLSAEMGAALLQRRMASALTDRRHQLRMRQRRLSRRTDEARLLSALRRLSQAIPPPRGAFCLRASFGASGEGAPLFIAESDGRVVRGGPVGGLPARFIPQVYGPDTGLMPSAARPLLRAWNTRRRGNEVRRARIQRELGASDETADLLCRWLSCQARLRSIHLLLTLGW